MNKYVHVGIIEWQAQEHKNTGYIRKKKIDTKGEETIKKGRGWINFSCFIILLRAFGAADPLGTGFLSCLWH